MEDTLTIATAEGVRIYAITTKNLVQEAADRHHTSHLATAALGRAMSGALMLAATMKDGERILLKLKGDGPMGEVVAEAQGTSVRGYVGEPDVFMPLKKAASSISAARLGREQLPLRVICRTVNRLQGMQNLPTVKLQPISPIIFICPSRHHHQSRLAYLVDKDGKVLAAGGYFIQAMPGCDEEDAEKTWQ